MMYYQDYVFKKMMVNYHLLDAQLLNHHQVRNVFRQHLL